MDETTAVTKQLVDEGAGTLLRVGALEYLQTLDGIWWKQPSGRRVTDSDLLVLLSTLLDHARELSPEEPKPLDVDEVYGDVLAELTASDEAFEEEHGRPPTPADRDRLCPSELAGALYGRDDSVAVAAVTEALERPYLDGTLGHAFRGEQECC